MFNSDRMRYPDNGIKAFLTVEKGKLQANSFSLGPRSYVIGRPSPGNTPDIALDDGYLYTLGGNSDTVESARIRDDGQLEQWAILPERLPENIVCPDIAVTESHVYVASTIAIDEESVTVIYRSKPGKNGATGNWEQSGEALNPNQYLCGVAVLNGRFYAAGGSSVNGYLKTVYSAPIDSGGNLGSWRQEPSMTVNRLDPVVIAAGDYLYAMGGEKTRTAAGEAAGEA
ncbi:MAG: hypothetical protein JXA46_16520 [Dehalococcoidales bacterium]|nr:hypothetical protein [Dehalococcoidales bacterium]